MKFYRRAGQYLYYPGGPINQGSGGGGGPVVPPSGGGFTPASLALTGYWKAPYSASPWPKVASAGTSGTTTDLTAAGASAGTPVGGFAPVTLNGTTSGLTQASGVSSSLISAANWTAVALINVAALGSTSTFFYDEPTWCCDTDGNWGCSITSSGARAGVYNGSGTTATTYVSFSSSTWAMVAARSTAGSVVCRVNGTTSAAVAGGSVFGYGGSATFRSAINYNSAKRIQGSILELMVTNIALSDANLDSIQAYFTRVYGVP